MSLVNKSSTPGPRRAADQAISASFAWRCFLAGEFGLSPALTTISFLALFAAIIAYVSRDR